jgi:hypothetical protein
LPFEFEPFLLLGLVRILILIWTIQFAILLTGREHTRQ